MAIHETDLYYNRIALSALNHAAAMGLADSDILSLTTVAGLASAITGLTKQEVDEQLQRQLASNITISGQVGAITNTQVAAADNLAGVRTVYTGNDSALSSTEDRTFEFTNS